MNFIEINFVYKSTSALATASILFPPHVQPLIAPVLEYLIDQSLIPNSCSTSFFLLLDISTCEPSFIMRLLFCDE